MKAPLFVTAAGTGVGKTVVTASLALAARSRGLRTSALKPVETGCVGGLAADARALAEAAGRPEDAALPGFHRVQPPLAPYAAALEGAPPAPPLLELARSILDGAEGADLVLVEGAGGLLVPYDRANTFADLARAIDARLLVVLPNALGVLHHAEATLEAAAARGLAVAAAILVDSQAPDLSARTNAQVISARHPGLTLLEFPWTDDVPTRRAAADRILQSIASDTI